MLPPVDPTASDVIAVLLMYALESVCNRIAPPPPVASLMQFVKNNAANVPPRESAKIRHENWRRSPEEMDEPAGIWSFAVVPPAGEVTPEVFVMYAVVITLPVAPFG